ncbi:aldo/keto reductase [Bartonella sp. LJL80]
MKKVTFPDGRSVPALGQGTWFMGEGRQSLQAEADSLRAGIDLGMTLIDTAEMYGNGGAEKVVGEAVRGRRDEVFIVSKVLPGNASAQGTSAACERSLKRLGTDVIDLYLLHWRGHYALEETVLAFEKLVEQGKIRAWGVSNLDTRDMQELERSSIAGHIATDQILYNLSRRGIEFDLLPWCKERNIPLMAYSPIEQGRILKDPDLMRLAGEVNLTPATIALAWVLRQQQMIAIPKASSLEHLKQNRLAADISLDDSVLSALDKIFLPPKRKMPLDVI